MLHRELSWIACTDGSIAVRIGYIGLGAMGGALARRLVQKHPLTVWDLNETAVQALVDQGATAAMSAVAMARECDIVVLCLPRSADVRQVIFGPGGLIEGLAVGTLVIDQTSGTPNETLQMARDLARRGISLIDAPVAGGVPAAQAGSAAIMVSGPDDAYAKAYPFLSAISTKVYRAGSRVGDGQAVKLINNSINSGLRIATLELVALGRKLGLELDAMTDALNAGWGGNFTAKRLLPALLERRPSADFALTLMVKDLNQVIALGSEHGVPLHIANLVRGLMQMAVNTLGNDAGLDDIVGFVETISKASLLSAAGDSAPGPSDLGAERAMNLIVDAAAACNRLITYENAALGRKLGLDIGAMATIVMNGSGWSAEGERIFFAISNGGQTTNVRLKEIIQSLNSLTALGFHHGAPTLVLNEIRATYEAQANESGPDAGLDVLFARYDAMAGNSFSGR